MSLSQEVTDKKKPLTETWKLKGRNNKGYQEGKRKPGCRIMEAQGSK